MKKDFARWFQKRLAELSIRPREVALKSGITESAFSRLIHRGGDPTIETLQKISPILGVTIQEILEQSGYAERQINTGMIKVIGTAKAGEIINEGSGELHHCPITSRAIYISGDSMKGLANDGDAIVYDPESPVKHGDLVYVKLKKHGAFFKRFISTNVDINKNATDGYMKMRRKIDKMRNADDLPIMLHSINGADYYPMVAVQSDIEFMYKVVAIRFK